MPPSKTIRHIECTSSTLFRALKSKEIQWGGNRKLKIYGTLNCKSGRRMNPVNRVFFTSESEAINAGYRPCGHCMRKAYLHWKKLNP